MAHAKIWLKFVILAVFCLNFMASVGAEPVVNAQPSEIESGLTKSLDVNCTFNVDLGSADVAGIISVTLSRANHSGVDFTELGTINEFGGQKVNILTVEAVTATGHLDQTGDSFLHLHWDQPNDVQTGIYQCSVQGLNSIGQNVVFVNSTRVTPHLAGLVDTISETNALIVDMANKIDTLEDTLINFTTATGIRIEEKVSKSSLWLERSFAADLNIWLNYEKSVYYKSSSFNEFRNINQSIAICKSYGGYLAVINNENEFNAIMSNFGFETNNYYIDGRFDTIKDKWVLNLNDQPLPYEKWYGSRPTGGSGKDCLALYKPSTQWYMGEQPCSGVTDPDNYNYLCEFERPV